MRTYAAYDYYYIHYIYVKGIPIVPSITFLPSKDSPSQYKVQTNLLLIEITYFKKAFAIIGWNDKLKGREKLIMEHYFLSNDGLIIATDCQKYS